MNVFCRSLLIKTIGEITGLIRGLVMNPGILQTDYDHHYYVDTIQTISKNDFKFKQTVLSFSKDYETLHGVTYSTVQKRRRRI